MKALILNGTLKADGEDSSTEKLSDFLIGALGKHGVEAEQVRLAAHNIPPGVTTDAAGDGDDWPDLHDRVIGAEIVIFATPTWLGQPSSVIKRALERMDAMMSEQDDDGVPVAFNKVAGFLVVGNEDGAHHCIAEMEQAATDIGFTVPGQAWTYWNKGPGPGEETYLTTDETEWTHSTGEAMAHVLVHVARALAANPIPKPPNA
jgi:multimeric flavodoxin WrbA